MPGVTKEEPQLDLAIIGGGITGLSLAAGLLSRNIHVTIYERARQFREIGAGIGFTPNAERSMIALDPRVHTAFKKVATPNETDLFRWVDGYTRYSDERYEELLFETDLGKRGFEGCHRAQFLDELVKLIPEKNVRLGKTLQRVTEKADGEKLLLEFEDGSTAEADAVIGCDGIRSRVRQLILGEDNPASYPRYSHKSAFRGLVSMDRAVDAMGREKALTRHMHLGQGAHVLTFPVAMGKLLNVVAFVTDPGEWPHEEKLSAPASKEEAVQAFSGFGHVVRAVMDLLPDTLDRWAVFDTYDHPASTYMRGRMCIAGDAAHASSPHHGAGAGTGIEDAAVLAAVLAAASETASSLAKTKAEALRAALATYNAIRLERSQWIVQSSRILGELYEWQYEPTGRDAAKCGAEVYWRSHQIWDYDVDDMLRRTAEEYRRRLE